MNSLIERFKYLFVIALLFSSVSCTAEANRSNDNSEEEVQIMSDFSTELYACSEISFKEEGFDLNKSLSDFEQKLIEDEFLKDASLNSYAILFKKLADGFEMYPFDVSSTYRDFLDIESYLYLVRECASVVYEDNAGSFATSFTGVLMDEIAFLEEGENIYDMKPIFKMLVKVTEQVDHIDNTGKLFVFSYMSYNIVYHNGNYDEHSMKMELVEEPLPQKEVE